MSFEFDYSADAETFRSVSALIKSNDGGYKSMKQKKYFESFLLSSPYPEHDTVYGVAVAAGMRIKTFRYTTRWADYGSRSIIPGMFVFLFDENGIVAKYKVPFNGNMRDGARPDPTRVQLKWMRPEDAVMVDFVAEEKAQLAKIAEENSNKTYIGKIDSRMKFVGKIVAVRSFQSNFKTHYYDTGNRYQTVLDVDGNTVVYWGAFYDKNAERSAEKGDTVEFMARIKDHAEYKGVKQTVITRPSKVTVNFQNEEEAV